MINVEQLKQEVMEIIETRYDQRQNNRGCGLLYSKLHTLEKSQNDIIFLGINSGGDAPEESQEFSYEDMVDEVDYKTWYKDIWYRNGKPLKPGQAFLQKQVNYLLETLLKCKTENVLSGNVVPFTSRNETSLNNEDWECGEKIWEKILNAYISEHGKVNIIVMGGETRDSILEIFKNIELELKWEKELPVGSIIFSNKRDMKSNFYKHGNNIKVCHLPHLSFKSFWECPILGRDEKYFSSPEKYNDYKELEKYIQDFFN